MAREVESDLWEEYHSDQLDSEPMLDQLEE